MTLEGTVINGTIHLDPPAQLAEGTRVEVHPKEQSEAEKPTLSALLDLAGTVDDLPSDMARNHDHYLHGAPKEDEPAPPAEPTVSSLLKIAGTATTLPPDFADQHDHYIHGTPKR